MLNFTYGFSESARPKLHLLSHVKSNVHMCNEAVLVRLTHGKKALRCIESGSEDYSVLLNNANLCRALIPSSGTSADMLEKGYGIEGLEVEALSQIRSEINGEYHGIKQAANNIGLLVGLLNDGLYLIADYEMYPVLDGSHFWNGDYNADSMLHNTYSWPHGRKIPELYDSPAYLFPSQSVKALNEDTLRNYVDRMTEGRRFPRAIAYYLRGCVALLLDGHHKAAASAYVGKTVKCLVIFHVEDTNGLMDKANGQQLF